MKKKREEIYKISDKIWTENSSIDLNSKKANEKI